MRCKVVSTISAVMTSFWVGEKRYNFWRIVTCCYENNQTPGKFPPITQVPHLIAACKMMSWLCCCVWVTSTKSPCVHQPLFSVPISGHKAKTSTKGAFYTQITVPKGWKMYLNQHLHTTLSLVHGNCPWYLS